MSDGTITLDFEGEDITALDADTDAPVFVASPIAKKPGYPDAARMLRGLDPDEKGLHIVETLGGPQKMAVITLPGLSHALNNRRPRAIRDEQAKATVIRFQRWVNHDLVPTVSRHGIYATDATIDRMIDDPGLRNPIAHPSQGGTSQATRNRTRHLTIREASRLRVESAPGVWGEAGRYGIRYPIDLNAALSAR